MWLFKLFLKTYSDGGSCTIWSNPFWYRVTSTFGKLILMAISTAEVSSTDVEKRSFLPSIILHKLENNWHVLFCALSLHANNFSFRMINPNFIPVVSSLEHLCPSTLVLLFGFFVIRPYFSLSAVSKTRQSHTKSSFNSFFSITAWDNPLGFVSLPEEPCAVRWVRDSGSWSTQGALLRAAKLSCTAVVSAI